MGVWKKGKEGCLLVAADFRRGIVCRGVLHGFGTEYTQPDSYSNRAKLF